MTKAWSVQTFKHISPDPAFFPCCNVAMGRTKLIIAKHMACHVTEPSPDSRKENLLSLLTGLGKDYRCILLPQIRPESKVLSSEIAFCAHMTRIAYVSVADFIAGSSNSISLIQNLFSQNQHKIACTSKQIFMGGRPEVLSQSLPSFRYRQTLANKLLWMEDLKC